MTSTILSLVLQGVLALLQWFGASAATIDAYMSLIESTKNDGLISVSTKDKFVSQKQAILDRLAAKQAAAAATPPKT